jgi:hypothetical protein
VITERGALLALVAVLLATTVEAEPVKWLATSRTAMSITGDIVVDDNSVTFADGKRLDLEPYEMAREGDWSASGDEIAGDVFKVEPPSNPELLRGNSFCDTNATYVVLWSPGEGELTLNVYSSDAAPTGDAQMDALCAIYGYETP